MGEATGREGECNCDETYGFNHQAGTVHCRKCGNWWKLKGEELAVVTGDDIGELQRLARRVLQLDISDADSWRERAEAAEAEVARLKGHLRAVIAVSDRATDVYDQAKLALGATNGG
jgi:hypothetical protein